MRRNGWKLPFQLPASHLQPTPSFILAGVQFFLNQQNLKWSLARCVFIIVNEGEGQLLPAPGCSLSPE